MIDNQNKDLNKKSGEQLFREEAVQQNAAPQEMLILFTPLSFKRRKVWYIIGFSFLLTLYWLFFGSVPIVFEGKGIVLGPNGLINTTNSQENLIYAFVDTSFRQKIHQNQFVTIEMLSHNEGINGSIKGRIISISSSTVSKEQLLNLIQDSSLVDFLIDNQNVIELMIKPSDVYNGNYKQYLKKDLSEAIKPGVVCKVKGIIEYKKPIVYLFY